MSLTLAKNFKKPRATVTREADQRPAKNFSLSANAICRPLTHLLSFKVFGRSCLVLRTWLRCSRPDTTNLIPMNTSTLYLGLLINPLFATSWDHFPRVLAGSSRLQEGVAVPVRLLLPVSCDYLPRFGSPFCIYPFLSLTLPFPCLFPSSFPRPLLFPFFLFPSFLFSTVSFRERIVMLRRESCRFFMVIASRIQLLV